VCHCCDARGGRDLDESGFAYNLQNSKRMYQQRCVKHSSQKLNDHFQIYSDKAELQQDGSTVLTLPFNSSFLPSLTLFRHGTAQASLNALYNTLVGDSNANLSPWTKHWLCWHYRLGHLGFEHVRYPSGSPRLMLKTLALSEI
jgi:hypothetical protein